MITVWPMTGPPLQTTAPGTCERLRVPVEPVQVARRITLQPLPGCYPAHGCGQRGLVVVDVQVY